jgi:hypothetical protein
LYRKGATNGLIDRPIWIKRESGLPLALRLVAVKKPPQAAAISRRQARAFGPQRQASDQDQERSPPRDRVILVTSLDSGAFSTADVLALYRLRWQLGFKRLKSVIGLKRPSGPDHRSARPYILAHLLIILYLEPLSDELEDSPDLAA